MPGTLLGIGAGKRNEAMFFPLRSLQLGEEADMCTNADNTF